MIIDLFKKTAAKRMLFFIAADIFFIAISVWLAFLLRFDANIPAQYDPFIIRMIVMAIIFIIPIFYVNKLYSFSWSYVSASELISLFFATTISFIFLSLAIFISYHSPRFINFPRSTIFISYILVFIFTSGIRFSKRVYSQRIEFSKIKGQERTLIIGAGDAGEQILRNIFSSKNHAYFPVGFVDDNPIKKGVQIHGIEVLGIISNIPNIIKSHQITQLIIALPTANSSTIRNAIALAKDAGIKKIKIAPPLNEIIRGEVSLKNLKDVGVEDLLGRDQVVLDKKQIEHFIKNKVVLITGAAGSIGSELSLQVAKFKPSKLIVLDQDETGIFNISSLIKDKFKDVALVSLVVDVQDQQKIKEIFSYFSPKIVFHAAAYKHVPLMEEQPDEAIKNNVFGTKTLIEACIDNRVENFILISTDKAVNPTSVMGSTKRVGEMLCQVYNKKDITKFASVRFGNVLNSRGSVIPIFKEQIRRGGPVEVTHPEMKRYFMLTSEACLLVMQAGAMSQGGELFVLDMGKPIKIVDLAREMIRLSGFEPDKDIAIIFTGVRPGEKLFEEIMTAQEGIISTKNQKIFIAKMTEVDAINLNVKLEDLKNMLYKSNKDEIVISLKNIINHKAEHGRL